MQKPVMVLALALVAAPVLADNAVRRGEGRSEERERGEGRAEASSNDSRGEAASPSRSPSQPPTTEAQRRHPRPGEAGHDRSDDRDRYHRGSRHGYYNRYHPYGRYGYGYYGYPYSYGYYGYGYGYGYGYRHPRYYRDTGAVRVQVEPERTKVFVDGYYAGVADDFDGIFQRLHVAPGRHDIELRLDGYRTQRFKVYVAPDHTIKLRHDMVRGDGVAEEDLVGDRRVDNDDDDRWDDRRRGRDRRDDDAEAGTLSLEVRPADASVYVDGEFRGSARDVDRLRLPAGRHRVEVVRPGFRTEEREVEIQPGRSSALSLELERAQTF